VRIVYKEWPIFGAPSERAAQVAIAADAQQIYALVHDKLMTASSLHDSDLRRAVELSGGDWPRIQRDLVEHRTLILAELERNRRQAFGLGLRGTPAYLIGPLLVEGALDEREFRQVFSDARRGS
jgi:protein-disulfide isomerase